MLTTADGAGQVEGSNGNLTATTLRAAIEYANQARGPDTIQFASAIAGQTITLTENDSVVPTAFGGATAFVVTDSLTIQGDASRGMTLDGGGTRRLFAVGPGQTLTLQALTLTGGAAIGGNGGSGGPPGSGLVSAGPGNGGGGGAGMGGAIYAYNATLNLLNCTLTNNVARGGAGGNGEPGTFDYVGGGGGGGSAAFAGGNGTFENGGGGGGGMNGPGEDGSKASGGRGGAGTNQKQAPANGTGTYGGGGGGGTTQFIVVAIIAHSGGPATLPNEWGFGGGGGGGAGNGGYGDDHGGQGGFGAGGGGGGDGGITGYAPHGGMGGFGGGGGGASNGKPGGSVFGGGQGGGQHGFGPVEGSAGGGGGAGLGGAIFINGGTANLTNCTITGNSAVGGAGGTSGFGQGYDGQDGQGAGGAVFVYSGNLNLNHCTVHDNAGSQAQVVVYSGSPSATAAAYLANGVISRSNPTEDADVLFLARRGSRLPRVFGVNNFISNPGRFPTAALAGTGDPLLLPLADNGGPVPTLLPQVGSPLIDAGHNQIRGGLPEFDQRGEQRLVNAFVDIGAVEVPWAASPFLRELAVEGGGRQPLRVVLTFSGPVTAGPNAFQLSRASGQHPLAAQVDADTSNGHTVVRLTLAGPAARRAGLFRLQLDGNQLFDLAGNPLPGLTQERTFQTGQRR